MSVAHGEDLEDSLSFFDSRTEPFVGEIIGFAIEFHTARDGAHIGSESHRCDGDRTVDDWRGRHIRTRFRGGFTIYFGKTKTDRENMVVSGGFLRVSYKAAHDTAYDHDALLPEVTGEYD